MGLLQEFKEFAVKGNMIDMAVGIIIGAAFGKIVSSLVKDIIMPPLGYIIGKVNFTDLAITLAKADTTTKTKAVVIKYGAFIQTIFDFLIIASAIFVAVKIINTLKKKEEEKPAEPPNKKFFSKKSAISSKAAPSNPRPLRLRQLFFSPTLVL